MSFEEILIRGSGSGGRDSRETDVRKLPTRSPQELVSSDPIVDIGEDDRKRSNKITKSNIEAPPKFLILDDPKVPVNSDPAIPDRRPDILGGIARDTPESRMALENERKAKENAIKRHMLSRVF